MDIPQIITLLTALVAAISGLIAAFKAHTASKVSTATEGQTASLRLEVNSRLSQLLRLTSSSSHAEGVLEAKTEMGKAPPEPPLS